jgi:hypothetical protein
VLCSDRFCLGIVAGRVVRTKVEAEHVFALADVVMAEKAPHSSCKGFFLILSSPSREVFHA